MELFGRKLAVSALTMATLSGNSLGYNSRESNTDSVRETRIVSEEGKEYDYKVIRNIGFSAVGAIALGCGIKYFLYLFREKGVKRNSIELRSTLSESDSRYKFLI